MAPPIGRANAHSDALPSDVLDLARRLAALTPDQRAALGALLAPVPAAGGPG